MKTLTIWFLGTLLALHLAPGLEAEIITPAAVRATSQFGLGVEIGNLIDASGLDGQGAEETQLHDNNPNHMWFAGCGDAGIEGGTPDGGCADPFAVAPVNEQIVEFELDAEYELSSALVWQYNELNPGAGPLPQRGVERLELAVSPSLDGPFTVVGTYDLDIGDPSEEPDTFSEPAQELSIEGSPVARRVRFNILSAQSGLPEDYVGLSEVRFDGTAAEGPLDPRVVRRLATDNFSDSTTPIGVSLDIVLDPDTGPFTLDIRESLPAGWEARDLTNDGAINEGVLSWEITTSEELTTLSFVLVPDDATQMDVTLAGSYTFEEGADPIPTIGDSRLTWVEARPAFRTPPTGGRVPLGGDFTFSVEAVGAQPLEYQWEKDGQEIDGATATTLALLDVDLDDAGEYAVVVTNELDTIVSDPVRLDVTPPNLALCGIASQSTTFGGAAVLAIDGNSGGQDFTQTAPGDPSPWWEVRLAQSVRIDTLVLWNQEVNPDNLSNFSVIVLDANREEVWSDEFFPAGDFPAFPDTSEQGFVIEVAVEGQIVRIEKGEDVTVGQTGPMLSLAEVEVFGEEPCTPTEPGDCPAAGDPNFADTHCAELSVEPPEGGGNGAYRVSAEGLDETGDPILYTFTARMAQGRTVVRGPQEVSWAFLPLTFGRWELSVTVDDRLDCEDAAVDAICTAIQDVLDPDCAPGEVCNVALRGVASQSSTFLFGPELAIDGNFDGDVNRFSVSHTGFDDPEPTWEVELDQDYEIENIVLWNRSDCCSDRLTNFTVSVLEANGSAVFEETFFADGTDFPPPGIGFEIPVGDESGRTVRVRLNDTHPGHNSSQFFLSLTEVEIYAEVSEICDNGLDDDSNGDADCEDASCAGTASCPDGALFVRGNADGDAGGLINITDGIFILNFLFLGGDGPPCRAAGDADDSGDINITDGIYVLNFLFLGGSPPPAPYPDCGVDPDGAPDAQRHPRSAAESPR